MTRARSRLVTHKNRKENGQFKKTNYLTRGWYDCMVLMIITILVYSSSLTVVQGERIAKAEEPPVGVVLNDTKLADSFIATTSATPTPAPIAPDDMSVFISQAVQEFLPKHKSESLMLMHCLAHRENGHAGNPNGFGDGGLAGGPYQFHQSTWERMRKQMIAQGLAIDINSRMDLKESTRTTAWAIANGRALEWGPILRDSKGNDFASCPKPSWYK